jgi:hypothetical protein
MTLDQRIKAFTRLGDYLHDLTKETREALAEKAANENPWFTPANIDRSLLGISKFLTDDPLSKWISAYDFRKTNPKVVGLVMAGNIPLVGFHDLLCVLISGHTAQLKVSSKDSKLVTHLIEKLIHLEPDFSNQIVIQESMLKNFDAVIATGSDNSAKHFDYYFRNYPHIIRRNRTSCAILTGQESNQDLAALGDDVFSYFGLGCRNVSKLFVPEGYDITIVLQAWENLTEIIHHHKYANNYDYQKSILLVNQSPFLDNGVVLFQENSRLVSPIAVVYYEYYPDKDALKNILDQQLDKIQCIVGNNTLATVGFGQAQYPEVWDYADRIDTLAFLSSL